MKIYPNPSRSTTYISVPNELVSGCNMTVTNRHGDLLIEKNFSAFSNTLIPLDLTNYPSGLYRVTLGNESHSESNELVLLSKS